MRGTTKISTNQMTVITFQEFTTKFSMDFPEMTSFYHIDDEQNEPSIFDDSDTYIDMDDYELQQQLY